MDDTTGLGQAMGEAHMRDQMADTIRKLWNLHDRVTALETLIHKDQHVHAMPLQDERALRSKD